MTECNVFPDFLMSCAAYFSLVLSYYSLVNEVFAVLLQHKIGYQEINFIDQPTDFSRVNVTKHYDNICDCCDFNA